MFVTLLIIYLGPKSRHQDRDRMLKDLLSDDNSIGQGNGVTQRPTGGFLVVARGEDDAGKDVWRKSALEEKRG